MKEHAALVIINEKNEILFIKRSTEKKTLPGAWSFPSGTVEDGENTYETAMREANEELGIDIEPHGIFATTDLSEFSVRLSFVLCSIKGGYLKVKQPEEIDRFEWMGFPDFFEKFSDDEIGHGLIWLRKNPDIWGNLNRPTDQ